MYHYNFYKATACSSWHFLIGENNQVVYTQLPNCTFNKQWSSDMQRMGCMLGCVVVGRKTMELNTTIYKKSLENDIDKAWETVKILTLA